MCSAEQEPHSFDDSTGFFKLVHNVTYDIGSRVRPLM